MYTGAPLGLPVGMWKRPWWMGHSITSSITKPSERHACSWVHVVRRVETSLDIVDSDLAALDHRADHVFFLDLVCLDRLLPYGLSHWRSPSVRQPARSSVEMCA